MHPFLVYLAKTSSLTSLYFVTLSDLEQSRATWPVNWYISTAVLPALPDDSQSEMMLTSHYGLSYLVTDGK